MLRNKWSKKRGPGTLRSPTHARREGGEGKVFPRPATFGGPRQRSEILKRVFQMASF